MSSDNSAPRISRTVFDGKDAWIKRPEDRRSNVFSFLHWCLGFFLPTALQPTGAQGGMESLQDEAERLTLFAAASIKVPIVLEMSSDHIVLSDCGHQLRDILAATANNDEKHDLLERAVRNLAALHVAGLTHGRPHLKDMTLAEDGEIYLLDLEEDPLSVMGLAEAQTRDIWLFLASCAEFCPDTFDDLTALLSVYQNAMPHDIRRDARALGRKLRPIRKLVDFARASNTSRDVFGAYWAIKVLESA